MAAVSFVIYYDPDAGVTAVERYNQAVALLDDARISYSVIGGDGLADPIPYSQHPPARVVARTHPLEEVHGQLFHYHRSGRATGGETDLLPFRVPRFPEADDGRFVQRGHRDAGRIRMHIIEAAENAVDTAHLWALHGHFLFPWTQIPIPGTGIAHDVTWTLDEASLWLMHFDGNAVLRVFGHNVESAEGRVRVTFYGPGSLVFRFRFTFPRRAEIAMYKAFLPISPLEQQVDYRWFSDRSLPRWFVWYVIANWASQLPQDIEIWQDTTFLRRPVLCRDDGPVHQMRREYGQFLSEEQTATDPVPQLRALNECRWK